MDDIDRAVLEAWERVMARCRADPAEARRRWRRTRMATFLRPPGAWCLKLRASDRRIRVPWNALAWPEERSVWNGHKHTLSLRAETVRELLKPVHIKWPGVPMSEAARLLGRGQPTLRSWIPVTQGRSRAELDAKAVPTWETFRKKGYPLAVRYDPATPHGHYGYNVPIVWSYGPLDPNAMRGEPPHPIWGSMWQHFHDQLLKNFELKFQRVPHFIRKRGWQFLGWRWVCRGRKIAGDPKGRHVPCGRTAKVLYGPMPIYTVAGLLGEDEGLEVRSAEQIAKPQAAGGALQLAGRWHPGLRDPRRDCLEFACKHCWKVQSFTLSHNIGWNNLITYITGGLLYGHEVERPAWVTYERKKREYRWGSTHRDAQAASGIVDGHVLPAAI